MSKESFEKKRRDAFLERMKRIYNGIDGDMIEKDHYSTLLAEKIYTLLQFEDSETGQEIVRKLNLLIENK